MDFYCSNSYRIMLHQKELSAEICLLKMLMNWSLVLCWPTCYEKYVTVATVFIFDFKRTNKTKIFLNLRNSVYKSNSFLLCRQMIKKFTMTHRLNFRNYALKKFMSIQ